MKKNILILTSMYTEDLRKHFNFLLENIDKKRYNVISPIVFVTEGDFEKLYTSVKNFKISDFQDINDKHNVYIGPSINENRFDLVIVLHKDIIQNQETYIENTIMKKLDKFNIKYPDIYRSDEGDIYFGNIDQAIEYLNKEY